MAVSTDSSGIRYKIQNYQNDEEREEHHFEERDMFMLREGNHEEEVREKEEHRRIDRDGDGMYDEKWDREDRGDNDLRELEQKLEEIYSRIKELKQKAEELHKLIAKRKGNRIPYGDDDMLCSREAAPVCALMPVNCKKGMNCPTVMPYPKTFSNSCEAKKKKAKILYNGVCKGEERIIDFAPPREEMICTREYAPVCAAVSEHCATGASICSGGSQRTYSNRCEAKAHNAEFLYNGACNMGTKATRMNTGTVKRMPAQRSRIMPDAGTMTGEQRSVRTFNNRIPSVDPTLMDSTFEEDVTAQGDRVHVQKTPVIRSGRWNSIMDFLRRR